MEKKDFLSADFSELRERLWRRFRDAEQRAREFCSDCVSWIPIKAVECGSASWTPEPDQVRPCCAVIRIPIAADDPGAIYHELFHSVFHGSPLWDQEATKCWGDGFCDAFRYFREESDCSQSDWMKYFEEWFERCREDGLADTYKGRGSLIVERCCRDYPTFQNSWGCLNDHPPCDLSAWV